MSNRTILQAFYWEMAEGKYREQFPEENNLWKLLSERAEDYARMGFSGIWVPPAQKGTGGGMDTGYGTYDLWDLGEFDQKGSVRTRYGTKEEFTRAIEAMHKAGLTVVYDTILNHLMGADEQEEVELDTGETVKAWTKFTFPGRKGAYSDFIWTKDCFSGISVQREDGSTERHGVKNSQWNRTYEQDYLMGMDIDHGKDYVRDELLSWGRWISEEIGVDGYRIDAAKHIDENFIRSFCRLQDRINKEVSFLCEAWINDTDQLADFIDTMDSDCIMAMDYPLRKAFTELANGDIDMRWLGGRGLVNKPGYGMRSVMFLDNHDTMRDQTDKYGHKSIMRRKYQAYTYILTREYGTPVVFWKDMYQSGMTERLLPLLEARKTFAYGAGRETETNDGNTYSYIREGDEEHEGSGLVMMITRGSEQNVIAKEIDSGKPDTDFRDITGNIEDIVRTDRNGRGTFLVRSDEDRGYSVWVKA